MYNKIFTKILDSSIWLAPTATRLVWITFLAAMDEDGFAQFASVANLAHRARVSDQEAQEAVKCLEAPDEDSSDPDHDGRRIERVPGGWMILNAPKYRALVTRIDVREGTKRRVAKHRQLRRSSNTDAGGCNAPVTPCNDLVTPSEAEAEAEALPPKEPTPAFSTPGRGKIREGSNADRLPTSPQAVRFAKLMHRKLTTPWQDNEIAAYKKIGRVPEDDLTALERYYGTHWPPKTGVNILRHDLLTLLNNLSGEIGRAHADETPAKAPAVKKPMRPML